MKSYRVTATAKYQAWNGTGRTFEVRAANAKQAVSYARRQAWADGTFSKEDGAISYSAEVRTATAAADDWDDWKD